MLLTDDDVARFGDGWRGLAAAIILVAVRDVRCGRLCDGMCRPGEYHICAPEAWNWLNSCEGRGLLEFLGIDADAALAALPEPEGEMVEQLVLWDQLINQTPVASQNAQSTMPPVLIRVTK